MRRTVIALVGVGVLVAGVAALIVWRTAGGGDDGRTRQVGQEAFVSGTVVENNLGCHAGQPCSLLVNVDDEKVKVVYHYGESLPCHNQSSAQIGEGVAVGARVQVSGMVEQLDQDPFISTCGSDAYAIRVIG